MKARRIVERVPHLPRAVARTSLIPLFVSALLLICGSAHAQNQRSVPTTATELGEHNMGLVAASAEDIKAVLVKDVGLMVEIKAWVAKDATDHGQVISEADLTNDAIFDRLDTDARFRSVATRLLQHYGYLVPLTNPDSPLGKEQELLIKERVKWLAQDEEEAQASARQQSSRNMQQGGQCNSQMPGTCVVPPSAGAIPVQGYAPQPGQPYSPYQKNTPTIPYEMNPQNPQQMPGGLLEQTRISPNGGPFSGPFSEGSLQPSMESAFGNGQSFGTWPLDMSDYGLLTPQLGTNTPGGEFPSLLPQGSAGLRNPVQNLLPNADSVNGGNGLGPLPNMSGSAGMASGLGEQEVQPNGSHQYQYSYQPYLYQKQLRAQPPEMERTPDPYSDIPSLYDMYIQTAPRPSAPERFGMDVFEDSARNPELIPMDLPAGPDYVVGPGDGLAIDLWGSASQRIYRVVDREGRVSLPEVGPVLVSGKSLADVQQAVQQALRSQFRDISADVSLARLRTVRVYVVGDVVDPGAYDISSLSTPLNALFAAGGPTSRGSLRIVKHYRGNQLVQDVDVYDLLLHGVKGDLERLENGDTVLVPPLGPQVTVEGMVRRPGIYELKNEKDLNSVLELAGGLLPTAALNHIEIQRTEEHAKVLTVSFDLPQGESESAITEKLESFSIHDGDKIRIFPIVPYSQNAVYLEGHVLNPGKYSYHTGMRVTDLISSYKTLLPQPAGQYAEIIRLNPPDFHPSVIGFNLTDALADPSSSPALEPLDTVRVFSTFAFENPPTVSVLGDVRNPGTYRTSGQVRLSDAVHLAGGVSPDAQLDDAQVFRYLSGGKLKIFSVNLNQALAGDPAENILLAPRDRLLIHRSPGAAHPATVYVQGEVMKPGRYPLTSNMTVADLIRVGGGLRPSADTQVGDLTRYQWTGQMALTGDHESIEISEALRGDAKANLPLNNGDVLTIRQLPGWDDLGASIAVRGEVKHPGTYGIRPGERLSSVLERAGGFTSQAYPYGAILQRTQVRDLEEKQQTQMILRVKDAQHDLELMPDTDPKQKDAKLAALAQYQTTLTQLSSNTPAGRVAIRISGNIKRWRNSTSDIEVRAGDTLFVPKRPDFVMVTGQVFNPTAVSYRPGKSAKWYLSQAGGPTTVANKKDIFVIRADGSVIGEKSSMWGGNSLNTSLEPGDMVVVPEKALGGGMQWQNVFTAAQLAASISSAVIIAVRY